MDLTEKEIIYSTDKRFDLIKELCHLSKNLYNAALYDVRQYYFETKSYRTWQSQAPLFSKNIPLSQRQGLSFEVSISNFQPR